MVRLEAGLQFFFLIIRRPPRSTLFPHPPLFRPVPRAPGRALPGGGARRCAGGGDAGVALRRLRDVHGPGGDRPRHGPDRKSTRLNSSHANISYAVFCLKKKKTTV